MCTHLFVIPGQHVQRMSSGETCRSNYFSSITLFWKKISYLTSTSIIFDKFCFVFTKSATNSLHCCIDMHAKLKMCTTAIFQIQNSNYLTKRAPFLLNFANKFGDFKTFIQTITSFSMLKLAKIIRRIKLQIIS